MKLLLILTVFSINLLCFANEANVKTVNVKPLVINVSQDFKQAKIKYYQAAQEFLYEMSQDIRSKRFGKRAQLKDLYENVFAKHFLVKPVIKSFEESQDDQMLQNLYKLVKDGNIFLSKFNKVINRKSIRSEDKFSMLLSEFVKAGLNFRNQEIILQRYARR